ncbi:MAG: sodium-translocating pyrophosphatase [Solirubrobacterales bacterium]
MAGTPAFIIAFGSAIIGLLAAAAFARAVLAQDAGPERVRQVGRLIQEGAMAFLKREYTILAVFVAIVAVLIAALIDFNITDNATIAELNAGVQERLGSGPWTSICYVLGAIGSALAGFIGMSIAVRGNMRTTAAAIVGLNPALRVAFNTGTVMGLTVVGIGLVGVTVLWVIFQDTSIVAGFAFGASSIALFARVGGGIYTKAADVGADLVGKVEAGIPEDDARNPATIADNVGDNVGDCAGMAADLFETYAVTLVAVMLIGVLTFSVDEDAPRAALYPLVLGGVSILASVIGSFFVRTRTGNVEGALYKGVAVAGVIAAAAFYPVTNWMMGDIAVLSTVTEAVPSVLELWLCTLVGLVVTGLIFLITDFYTSTRFKPVKSIAEASQTGHATNIIAGLAVGFRSTAAPALVFVLGIVASYNIAGGGDVGVYGIGVAVMAMLSLCGLIVALDAFGPITDNAGGIAEMADMPEEVRAITDPLDAVGNTTKAVTKGYAIGSAVLAAIVLFAAVKAELPRESADIAFAIDDPSVLSGLLIGGIMVYLFVAFAMQAVGRAGGAVVDEVRRQFKENPGIMDGSVKPEYGQCVDIVTKAAQREMIIPALIPIIGTAIIGGFAAIWKVNGLLMLGGLLMGVIVVGMFVAISMTNGGGAWDNAKKLIEDGAFGGKGSIAHEASITGDTVGDPYKDTAGPAINPMIKVANIVALLMIPLIT